LKKKTLVEGLKGLDAKKNLIGGKPPVVKYYLMRLEEELELRSSWRIEEQLKNRGSFLRGQSKVMDKRRHSVSHSDL
jgi:hypothetical protein